MNSRPPEDLQEPDAEELRALDAYIDSLAASVPSQFADFELASLVHRLDRLPESIWESAAPLYQPLAPVIEIERHPDRSHRRPRRVSEHRIGRTWTVAARVAMAAAVVVVLAVVGINAFSGQPSPRPVTGAPAVPNQWRLAGFIDQAAWQQSPSSGAAVSSVSVTCPAVSTCYADNPGGSVGNAVVEATTDGGDSWHALALPAGTWLTSDLACPTTEHCLVGGYTGVPPGVTPPAQGVPAIFTTVDGGSSWTTQTIPGVVQLVAVACGTSADCVASALGAPTAADPEGPSVVVRTTDSGTTWSVSPLPGAFAPANFNGLSCTGLESCVMVGTSQSAAAISGEPTVSGAALYSADGGATWSAASVPAGPVILRAVSCSSAEHCAAIGNGPSTVSGGATNNHPYGPSEALASTDGGRTWQLTASAGLAQAYLTDLSCSTAADCWATGFRGTPQAAGSETGTIVSSHDGGTTWTTEALPTTQTAEQQQSTNLASLDIQNVSSISCLAGGQCVSMAAQGTLATSTQQHLALRN